MFTSFFSNTCKGQKVVIPNEKGKYAYALYLQKSETLAFIRSDEIISSGDIYCAEQITEVFSDFEGRAFNKDNAPWSHVIGRVKDIKIENHIDLDISHTFDGYTQSLELKSIHKLNTEGITDMTRMFQNVEQLNDIPDLSI